MEHVRNTVVQSASYVSETVQSVANSVTEATTNLRTNFNRHGIQTTIILGASELAKGVGSTAAGKAAGTAVSQIVLDAVEGNQNGQYAVAIGVPVVTALITGTAAFHAGKGVTLYLGYSEDTAKAVGAGAAVIVGSASLLPAVAVYSSSLATGTNLAAEQLGLVTAAFGREVLTEAFNGLGPELSQETTLKSALLTTMPYAATGNGATAIKQATCPSENSGLSAKFLACETTPSAVTEGMDNIYASFFKMCYPDVKIKPGKGLIEAHKDGFVNSLNKVLNAAASRIVAGTTTSSIVKYITENTDYNKQAAEHLARAAFALTELRGGDKKYSRRRIKQTGFRKSF